MTSHSPDPADHSLVGATTTSRERWAVAAITAAFVCLVALWSVITPLYDAPDEPLHLNSAIRLADGGGWPDPGEAQLRSMVLGARAEASIPAAQRSTFAELDAARPGYHGVDQMTQHPPLYYAYAAAVLDLVDFMDIRADLALLAARLAGLLFALPLPFMAWDSVRRLTRSPKAGIVGAAAVLAVPQLAHIMGAVSNDGAAIALSSAVVWLSVRVMTGDRRWIVVAGIGVALALALLTKGTTLPLVPFAAVVLLIWPRELRASERILRSAVAMALGFAGGWWWARNLIVHGSLQPDGLVYPTNPWPEGTGPDLQGFLDTAWGRLPNSFWGNFGWLSYPLPAVLTDALTVVALTVVIGFAFRRTFARGYAIALATLPAVFLAALFATTWSGYVRTQLPAGLQGRYLFVAIIALIGLSAIGWMNFVTPQRRRAAGTWLLALFVALAITGVAVEAGSAYTSVLDLRLRVPIGTVGLAAATFVTAVCVAAATVLAIRVVRRPLVAPAPSA